MAVSDDERQLLARFAERAREALLADGWELGPEGPATGESIFLGSFQQSIAPDFVAFVEFILESGPIISGVELHPIMRVVRTRRLRASVGGEIGVRHLPTERLLVALEVQCDADISLDLAEIFEARGDELPVFTDEASADVASRVMVDVVAARTLPFARENVDVDRMVRFVREGGQTTRDEMFEYLFVPALLAATGRTAEAHAALEDYHARTKRGAEQKEFSAFRDRLNDWLRPR